MKKFLVSLFAILSIAAIFAFAGCADGKTNEQGTASGNVALEVQSAVFTASNDVLALNDSTSVKDYMDVLAENGELKFGGSESEYGFYITSVYNTSASTNSYWAVYTDLVTIEGDETVYSNAEYGTFTYGGKTLYSASFGVSGLPCIDGYTYALVYTTF